MKLIITILISLSTIITVNACSCHPKPDTKKAYKQTDVIIAVKVLERFNPSNGTDSTYNKKGEAFMIYQLYGFDIKAEVISVYKGKKIKKIMIIKGSGGNCEYNFKVGQSYLIYGNYQDNEIYTSVCTRTAPLEENSDLAYLKNKEKKRKLKD